MKFLKKKEDTFDYALNRTCLTCATAFAGRYCPRCGERVIEPDDRSFKHFLSGVFNAFTFIDGKFFRSLKMLLLNPGALSRDIVQGIRQPYMKPIAFFFVGNFIYFLVPIFQTFNTNLYAQMNLFRYNQFAQGWVNKHLAASGSSLEQFSVIYNQASEGWSKLLLIVLVLLFFPLTTLINYTRRNYLSDHLAFSLEFSTYVIFIPTILLAFLLYFIYWIASWFGLDLNFMFYDDSLTKLAIGVLLYFFIRAPRTFYQFPWWRVIVNIPLHLLATVIMLECYRFILFTVTMLELTR